MILEIKNILLSVSLKKSVVITSGRKMLSNFDIVNKPTNVSKLPLQQLIAEKFTPENGKFFFSIEVTPRAGLKIDFNQFKTLPLFVDITWIKDENLKVPIKNSPAFELARKIKSSQVVNTVTCYKLNDEHIDEILSVSELIKNFTIVRGGDMEFWLNITFY